MFLKIFAKLYMGILGKGRDPEIAPTNISPDGEIVLNRKLNGFPKGRIKTGV